MVAKKLKKKILLIVIIANICVLGIVLSACNHKHSLTDNWFYDESGHWLECTGCKELMYKGEHTYDAKDVCMVCGLARPEDGELEYTLSDDGAAYIVSGIGNLRKTEVVIPQYYKGTKVTEIADNAFAGTDITELIIPEGLKRIGDAAFWNCRFLSYVKLPDSLETVGDSAFDACIGLQEVVIGDGVKSVGSWAFARCVSLEKVSFGAMISKIGSYAFYGCGLSNIFLPDNIECIGSSAFEECRRLSSVKLGNGINEIPDKAFLNCVRLTSLTIGSSVISVGSRAFDGCGWLVEIYNYSPLEIVKGDPVLYGGVGLNALDIYVSDSQSKLSENNEYVFYKGTDGILLLGYKGTENKLLLPENFEGMSYSISKYAFSDNDELISVKVPDGVSSAGEYAFSGCHNLKEITIGSGIKTLNDGLFYNCTALESVSFEGNIAEVGKFAFYNCSSLENIELPDSVVYIGGSAFYGCTALADIKLSCELKTIGMEAFGYCTSLKSVTIPAEVTMIEKWTFRGCEALAEVVFENPNEWYYVADASFEYGRRFEAEVPETNARNLVLIYNDFYIKRK